MINTIIFDFFGVMSTEVAPFLFAEVFEPEEAKRLKEEYMQPADRGDVSERELYESLGRLFSRTAEEVEADFLSRAVIDRSMIDLAVSLKKDYRVCLLSNAPCGFLDKVFAREGLDGIFDPRIVSCEVGMIKPSPEIFEHLLDALGISPSEAVFIDDNEKNSAAASALGIHGITFEGREALISELSSLGVTVNKGDKN